MKLHRLETTLHLPIGLDEAWDFFSDPRNLREITPPSLDFQVTSELPPRMYPGMIISYTVRPLLGVRVAWVTEITHVEEPHRFVDEQRFGPYRFWHHQHLFRETDAGVEMTDLVHYASPTPAGRLVDRWIVGPRVREIFEYRGEVLRRRFAPNWE